MRLVFTSSPLGLQEQVQEPNADFAPNLVNTVCFLVQFIIQLITFGVNYQGPPFNTAIADTKALRGTFTWGSLAFVLLALDLIPGLTEAVSLVRAPCPLATSGFGCFVSDTLSQASPGLSPLWETHATAGHHLLVCCQVIWNARAPLSSAAVIYYGDIICACLACVLSKRYAVHACRHFAMTC